MVDSLEELTMAANTSFPKSQNVSNILEFFQYISAQGFRVQLTENATYQMSGGGLYTVGGELSGSMTRGTSMADFRCIRDQTQAGVNSYFALTFELDARDPVDYGAEELKLWHDVRIHAQSYFTQ